VRHHRPAVFLGKVWLLAMVIRLALWLLPFGAVQRLAGHWGRPSPRAAGGRRRNPAGLAAAVRYATRYVPQASCLTQALVAQVLLRRAGFAPALRIGLARGPGGALSAHAWLENQGEIVIGGDTVERFTALGDPELV
jgi:hypothetical protein